MTCNGNTHDTQYMIQEFYCSHLHGKLTCGASKVHNYNMLLNNYKFFHNQRRSLILWRNIWKPKWNRIRSI